MGEEAPFVARDLAAIEARRELVGAGAALDNGATIGSDPGPN
jgi:hypothetical protein